MTVACKTWKIKIIVVTGVSPLPQTNRGPICVQLGAGQIRELVGQFCTIQRHSANETPIIEQICIQSGSHTACAGASGGDPSAGPDSGIASPSRLVLAFLLTPAPVIKALPRCNASVLGFSLSPPLLLSIHILLEPSVSCICVCL